MMLESKTNSIHEIIESQQKSYALIVVGIISIMSFVFSFVHWVFNDNSGAFVLLVTSLIWSSIYLVDRYSDRLVNIHIIIAPFVVMLCYFQISAGGINTPHSGWLLIGPLLAYLSSGANAAIVWFGLTILSQCLVFVFSPTISFLLKNYLSYVPLEYQHYDFFLSIVGQITSAFLLVYFVSRIRNKAYSELAAKADALREREARLQMAQKVAHIGSFDWNPISGDLWWSDEHYMIWGYTPSEILPSYQRFRERIHPDDIDMVESLLKQAMRGGDPYDCQHRIILPDGSHRYIHSKGKIYFDSESRPIRMIGTVYDLTSHKLSEMALEDAREYESSANKAKSEFLASMSHEIRTPMNGIIGMLHLALKSNLTDKQKQWVSKAYNSSIHLMGVLSDVLDFSKIEAGTVKLVPVPFYLKDIFDHLEDIIKHGLADKNIEFRTIIQSDVPNALLGDDIKIRQILVNLASNAAKFVDDNGRIIIKAEIISDQCEEVQIKFTVSDNGIGISDENKKKLFKTFSQIHNRNSRKYGGTGLGLAISKSLVEAMGGKIWFDSQEGIGSDFMFTLRLRKSLDTINETSRTSVVHSKIEALKDIKILVVEDNDINQEIVVDILSDYGVDITTASDGAQAVELVDKNNFDIILMDCEMPIMNGYDATTKIRNNLNKKQMIILGLSANATTDDFDKAIACGMNDYLTKPINPDVMILKIIKWVIEEKLEKVS